MPGPRPFLAPRGDCNVPAPHPPLTHRHKAIGRRYQTSNPLNRLVDATRPESLVAREFAKQVEDFLGGDPTMEKTIEHRLITWRDQHQPLLAALAASPSGDEIEPLSRALKRLDR